MDFHHDRNFFETSDYVIFSITLIIPVLSGIYYAVISKKKPTNVSEYLLGSRNMKTFPVSMSLTASYINGFILIGSMSEVYFYGIQFLLQTVSIFIASSGFAVLYLPVFYNLKITSTYEYLQMRFDYKVRLLGSFLFVIKTLIDMAITIYAPILMFEQVIGVNINIMIFIFSGICVVYTTFGGVRGVIWADTFQMILMLVGMIIIVIIGVYDVGGVGMIWEINKEGERLKIFDFNPDPRLRQSFWAFFVGHSITELSYLVVSQFAVQRCVSLPTLSKANIAVTINLIIAFVTVFLACFFGLMFYAAFHDCDPISAQKISKPDQLLIYFIMNLKNRIPALSSVVISIVYCTAFRPITDTQGSFYMKIIVVVSGILYTAIIYTLQDGSSVFQISISLISISIGPTFGIFTLGVLFPWANANGAFVGGVAGTIIVAWMSTGAQIAVAAKQIIYPTLPLSIENCENSTTINFVNETLEINTRVNLDEPFFLYSISFFYYPMIGALTAIIVGMIVSYFTGANKPKDMDPKFFSPVIHKHLKRDGGTSEMTRMTTN